MSIADGDDEDTRGTDNSQFGKAPPSRSLEDHVLQIARRDSGAVYRAALRQVDDEEVPIRPQGIPYNTQHLMHDVRGYWRIQGYSALRYRQEQFENAARLKKYKLQLLVLRIVNSTNDFQIQGR